MDIRQIFLRIRGHAARVVVTDCVSPGAPTVLALHGFTGSGEDFNPLRAAMGESAYRWICPDFMGHGGSDAPPNIDPYRLPAALALIDQARARAPDPDRVILLGYSMGGRLALHYLQWARPLPTILIGASPGLQDVTERRRRRQADAALIIPGRTTPGEFCDRWESQPLIHSQTRLPEPLRSDLASRRRRNSLLGLAQSLAGCGTGALPSLWGRLASLPPTLFLHGATDGKFASIGRLMAREQAGLQVVAVPEAGHAPHLEQPAATAACIRDFLAARGM